MPVRGVPVRWLSLADGVAVRWASGDLGDEDFLKIRRATAKDVAKLAGCSVSAVSLVVRNRDGGRINGDLKARIQKAVSDLDYRPNSFARSLVSQLPSSISVVVPSIRNPFFGEMLEGILQVIGTRFTIQLHVPSEDMDYGIDIVRAAQEDNIAGLILATPPQTTLDSFRQTCPTVILDAYTAMDVSRIELNVVLAGHQLGRHLVELGHRSVGYLDFLPDKATFSCRREALGAVVRQAGGALHNAPAPAEYLDIEQGEAAFSRSWPLWEAAGVTAIVAADDILAYGIMKRAQEMGMTIPDRLSVASFNDIPFSALVSPALTTVDLRAHELGLQAARVLLDAIAREVSSVCTVDPELRVRRSTGSRRAGP
ncbi:LacI family DNA-binding transcriptional regulator [Gluconacetobacter dulcium]|uniref:LacI family DNA-binding transcriptional regulator n=1 Tax=Gluconacetobacter dulcium TaxID=2729096 RepID=UPI001FE894B3|nr:LacI family DNA-binding transcriptional regulator [Gluconacetobacter dulcium]